MKVTLIEEDTALVSWKPPDEPNVAVTHYTILYASRKAWVAGEWQVLQREGNTGSVIQTGWSFCLFVSVKTCEMIICV